MIATLQCAVKKQGQVTLHYTSRDVLQTSQSSKTLSSEPSALVYDNNGNEVPLGCPARHLSLRHQASEPGEAGHGQGAPQGGEVLEAMLLMWMHRWPKSCNSLSACSRRAFSLHIHTAQLWRQGAPAFEHTFSRRHFLCTQASKERKHPLDFTAPRTSSLEDYRLL